MRVVVVEDDAVVADRLRTVLKRAGHFCTVYPDAAGIMAGVGAVEFDLLLLDWVLPDLSGLQVLRWLRQLSGGARLPVIMITSRADEDAVVEALGAGADDYLAKPVREAELLARVQALLRRSGPRESSTIVGHGPYRVDLPRSRIILQGLDVPLTDKEFKLAALLLAHVNRPVSRAFIEATVWGTRHRDLQTRTLDAHISKLRGKLRFRPEHGYRLVAVYNHGYRLETVDAEPASALASSAGQLLPGRDDNGM